MGKFHLITYTITSIFWLCDGAEIIALSLLNYVLVNVVWFRDLNDLSLLGSALFGGYFVGSIITGPITTYFGRRKPFLVYMILVFLLGVLSAISPNFTFLVVTRSLYGVLVGILSPLTSSMVAEITPKASRGLYFVVMSAFFTVGEAIAVFIGALLQVEEKGSENWRFLLIWVSVPPLISLVLGLKYLEESPRYHLMTDADEGVRVLNLMHKTNHNSTLSLSANEFQQIQRYVEVQKQVNTNSPFRDIVSKDNLRITISLWIAWWVLSFVYYGIVYVLPLVLAEIHAQANEESNTSIGYWDILLSVLAELPSYIVAFLTIEHKALGRRQSLAISFALTGVCCLGAHFFVEEAFMLFIFFAKFLSSTAYNYIYPLTTELYHTSCRTTGLGFASAMSKVGGAMMPWITVWALKISPTTSFVIFGGLCFLAASAVALLPYDTTGRELDKTNKYRKL